MFLPGLFSCVIDWFQRIKMHDVIIWLFNSVTRHDVIVDWEVDYSLSTWFYFYL